MPASEELEDQSLMTAESEDERDSEEYRKLLELYDESMRNLTEGEIVTGRIIGVTSNAVIVDVGYKSEGLIPIEEFTDRGGELSVKVGEEVEIETEGQKRKMKIDSIEALPPLNTESPSAAAPA